jgi:ABC-type multidrug transport system fused ATPase/permease subunit
VAINDAVYNLKVPEEDFAMVPIVEKEEMSDSELFGLFVKRRGGPPYMAWVVVWTGLMIATNTWLFFWLNHWMNEPDNTSAYYYYVYLILLVAGLLTIAAHCFMEYNSEFFDQMHRMMVSRLLVAPMSYFETTSIANTMNKLSSDLKKIDSEVVAQFRNALFFISLAASFFVNSVMVYIRKDEIMMIVVVVALIVVIVYYYYYFIVASKQVHRLEQNAQINIYSCFGEIMVGAATIRAYQKEQFMKEKQVSVIERYLMTEKVMAGIHSYSVFLISLIISAVTTLLFIKLFIFDKSDKVEFFLIYNLFAFERTLENLQLVLSDFLNSLKYLEYCEELMAIPQEEGYDLVPAGQGFEFKERVNSRWINEGRIDFCEFSVKYRA